MRVRKGIAGFSPKGIRRFVPLRDLLNLPVDSSVDATDASVTLQSAKTNRKRQSATLSSGMFKVLQSGKRAAKGLTDIVMKGGSFAGCASSSSAGSGAHAARRSKRVVRRLRTNAKGRFRTRGRYSAATVRGTKYEMIDRCDGTLTKVTRGQGRRYGTSGSKKTVIVRAGKSYLARVR